MSDYKVVMHRISCYLDDNEGKVKTLLNLDFECMNYTEAKEKYNSLCIEYAEHIGNIQFTQIDMDIHLIACYDNNRICNTLSLSNKLKV